ncbi:carnitine O-palmitoyltransferase 1, muscle isoform-like isoform X1 [Styela clava]
MAEAHAAVAFQFTVTPDGLRLHISSEALRAVYLSGIRSWRKRATRFRNRFLSGVYPATFSSLFVLIGVVTLVTVCGFDLSFGYIPSIAGYISTEPSKFVLGFAAILFTTIVWTLAVLLIRYTLKLLLCYHGWMFEPRGKVSITTKLWAVSTKLLCGKEPRLFSYQASLPRLPVPSVKNTVQRYLRSVRPLLADPEYDSIVSLSQEFEATLGSKLQRYLILKSWWSTNYVTDWWEQYVYLAGRGPIMVNSNYYGMDLMFMQPTSSQISRAATITHALFAFRSTLDKEKIKPIQVNGLVPLCSFQYERVFNTSRSPGIDIDQNVHYMDCRHVAVYHAGRWFKVPCYKHGILLRPKEIESQMEAIINDPSPPSAGEEHLGALTAGERRPWAEARRDFFKSGVNKESLHAIEKAAFVVVLDDESHVLDVDDATTFSKFGRSLLHGKCHNRWFDKSFQVIFYKNGRFGMNAEHSWADAPIMSHLTEEVLYDEFANFGYNDDGTCVGELTTTPLPPQRLKWNIPEPCIDVIDSSLKVAKLLSDDVDLHVFPFRRFGKGLIKTFRMSPDAFIQLSLQLAHFRDKGHFSLTYEASMTRLFREGRTETVRSCTTESCAFVRAMEDPEQTNEDRIALLKKATERHVSGYKEAMTGQGIDRHLFCLYVVSKYLKIESPFLQKVLGEAWELSTSQTAINQTGRIDHYKDFHTDLTPQGGGFGPVADDGYGVSYIICHENTIMFHISSKVSSHETVSILFIIVFR